MLLSSRRQRYSTEDEEEKESIIISRAIPLWENELKENFRVIFITLGFTLLVQSTPTTFHDRVLCTVGISQTRLHAQQDLHIMTLHIRTKNTGFFL